VALATFGRRSLGVLLNTFHAQAAEVRTLLVERQAVPAYCLKESEELKSCLRSHKDNTLDCTAVIQSFVACSSAAVADSRQVSF
jgi:hypothetical protein